MTGNDQTGIRDYALDNNPLNYSDVGFDLTGPEVHADGEIRNAVNYDLRQALVKKYDAKFPSSDAALQLRCADGVPALRLPPRRSRPSCARATGAGSRSCSTPSCSSRATRAC